MRALVLLALAGCSGCSGFSPAGPFDAVEAHDAAPDALDAPADASADVAPEATPDAPAPLCCVFDDTLTGGTAAAHCASGVATCHEDAGTCSTPLSASGQGFVQPCQPSCDGSVLVCT